MPPPAPSALYTCRYWALGPACPNFTSLGVSYCDFAHRDTGVIASALEQRGTCKRWIEGVCQNTAKKCFYEHRITGVDGINQGQVRLHGLNLEIANAAQKAGFNTLNQDALYDLIWSVKRVVLRHTKPNGSRPVPKHPVYPDRYRVSGFGDNTQRKRKQLHPESKQKPDKAKQGHGSSTIHAKSTSSSEVVNLVDLTSDHDTVPIKRQRLNDGSMGPMRLKDQSSMAAITSGTHDHHTLMRAIGSQNKKRADVTADRSDAILSSWNGENSEVKHHTHFSGSASSAFSIPYQHVTEVSTEESMKSRLDGDVDLVQAMLQNVHADILASRKIMCEAWNRDQAVGEPQLLAQQEVFTELNALSEYLTTTENEVAGAIECVTRVRDSVNASADGTDGHQILLL